MTPPLATATARSMAFSSSRTLPGQAWRHRPSSASRDRLACGPALAAGDLGQEVGRQDGDVARRGRAAAAAGP